MAPAAAARRASPARRRWRTAPPAGAGTPGAWRSPPRRRGPASAAEALAGGEHQPRRGRCPAGAAGIHSPGRSVIDEHAVAVEALTEPCITTASAPGDRRAGEDAGGGARRQVWPTLPAGMRQRPPAACRRRARRHSAAAAIHRRVVEGGTSRPRSGRPRAPARGPGGGHLLDGGERRRQPAGPRACPRRDAGVFHSEAPDGEGMKSATAAGSLRSRRGKGSLGSPCRAARRWRRRRWPGCPGRAAAAGAGRWISIWDLHRLEALDQHQVAGRHDGQLGGQVGLRVAAQFGASAPSAGRRRAGSAGTGRPVAPGVPARLVHVEGVVGCA